ncbi:hypothetical protein Daus18300_005752 [Diaporthe australafricana]|uniref:AT hook domain-containing protein n=1 Tax=Diaporthe australafricana TaxID=127596 RepID=A0ABR3WZN8_9PEZI
MDTPNADVVKDSQASGPNITPGSVGWVSPLASQHAWTGPPPRRRQVQQKAKASFLADDDEQDEDDFNDVFDRSPDHHDDGLELESTTPGRDSEQDRDLDEDHDLYAESPAYRASQAFRLPPQSAQPAQKSNMSETSDESSVFQALKKPSTTAATSHTPSRIPEPPEKSKQKQNRALATREKTATKDKKETPAKLTTTRPKKAAGKSIANSKVKLSALEVEIETETGDSDVQEPPDYDYSLPASNSSSPAAAPAKKKATAKRQPAKKQPAKEQPAKEQPAKEQPAKEQPAKKPATKTKPSAPKAKSAAGVRAKNTKPAPASIHPSLEADLSDKDNNEDATLLEEHPSASEELHDAKMPLQTRHEQLQSSKSATANKTQDVVMISSNSSDPFSESDNEDDEDFECSNVKAPSNAGRKTRATTQIQAAKEPNKTADGHTAAVSNSRRHAFEDETGDVFVPETSKRLPNNLPPKRSAAGNTKVPATREKPRVGPVKDTMSSKERIEGKSAEEIHATASRITKNKAQMKEAVNLPSDANGAEKGEANDLGQTAEPVKPAKYSHRKPNIIAFGLTGPKNNGKSHKTTTTTNSRPELKQADLSTEEQQTAVMAQLHRSVQISTKAKSKGTPQDDESFANGFVDHPEGDSRRAAKTTHSTTIERINPSSPRLPKMNTERVVAQRFDTEATGTTYEAERSDAPDRSVAVDAEADVVLEDSASVVSDSQQDPINKSAAYSDEFGDENMSNPLAHVNPERPRMRDQRTILGEVGIMFSNYPKVASAAIPRPLKRKLPVIKTIQARSPIRISTALDPISAATNLPSEDHERFAKKARYRSDNAVRDDQDAIRASNFAGRSDRLHRKTGGDSSDDVFGPGKEGQAVRSSAFVQRLISQESTERERDQDQPKAAALRPADGRAGSRRHPAGIPYSAADQSAAPEALHRPYVGPKSNDIEQRVLAALVPEKMQDVSPWPLDDDRSKRFGVGDDRNSWPTNPLDQERASDLDTQNRAWKKASEPYADSLGETMHKIVNTILLGLKTKEAAIGDVIQDYRTDGKRIVKRIADKHKKERAQVIQEQERIRLGHIQILGEARRLAGTLKGKLESVDLDKTMSIARKDASSNGLKRLRQAMTDA